MVSPVSLPVESHGDDTLAGIHGNVIRLPSANVAGCGAEPFPEFLIVNTGVILTCQVLPVNERTVDLGGCGEGGDRRQLSAFVAHSLEVLAHRARGNAII